MSQKRDSSRQTQSLNRCALLLAGVAWLSGTGIPAALAQTPSTDAPTVPSAQDLLQAPAAPAAETAPTAPTEPAAPAAPAAPTVSTQLEQSAPTAASPPRSANATVVDTIGGAAAPRSTAAPALVAPNLSEKTRSAFSQKDSAYIDPTPYALGATQVDQPDVVLSERSTGCSAVLRPGQAAPGSICPPPPVARSYSSSSPSFSAANFSTYTIAAPGSTSAAGRSYNSSLLSSPFKLNNVSLLFPLSIPAAITSAFGWRIHPITGAQRFHAGTDLGAPQGTPVLAAFSGKVALADVLGGYGMTIVLQHNKDQQETLYGHLSQILVKPGQWVKQGETIGLVGSTGLSTGPHLHFEFRQRTPQGWVVMDPGQALQFAVAQLIHSLQVAQAQTHPHTATR